MKTNKMKRILDNLNAQERACEEVLDADTLKAVIAAKRRIQERRCGDEN